MCSETRGATPVYRCTWAASSSFSYGSRATPGWPKTLNRVPELPNAHDGSSIVCGAERVERAAAEFVGHGDSPIVVRWRWSETFHSVWR